MIAKKEAIRKGWKQYPSKTAGIWDEFISWERRRKGEGNFFVDMLRRYNARTVLDIACGTGYDSIRLVKEGFGVKSCDGSREMIAKAKENAIKQGAKLDLMQCDWRDLVNRFRDEKFDAVICLGNSFTHLFSRKERESVMNQLYFLLKKGGILIIDQRNYDYLLSHGYKSKHKHVYCGKTIDVALMHKESNLITFRYTKRGNGYFELDLYPITISEMKELIKQTGFESIMTYGDFEGKFDPDNTDFIQHVAVK